MLSIVKRVLKLAGEHATRIKVAFVISFFEGIFAKVPILLVLYILLKMVQNTVAIADAWTAGIAIIVSVILRVIAKRVVDGLQSGTGHEIFARERMRIGDRLKRFPMGYFSEGNIGNITAVITSDLEFIEGFSMRALSMVVNGYLSTIIGITFLTILDYRIGLISIVTIILAILALKNYDKVVEYHSGLRQETQSRLISAVLEYVKGMTVIKSFNMVGERAAKINRQFKESRDTAIDFEKKVIPPILCFKNSFTFGIGLTILVASYLALQQTLDLSLLLMIVIFIFELYLPFKALGDVSAQVRIMEAGLDRYAAINNVEIIDEDGQEIGLTRFDIEFKNVGFAYEQAEVLRNISFKVPERSMTALVGKSGCGKTTVANLMARFWDVQKGEVLVGGVNVKAMSCDSLLKNISMVFQRVYLFNDTILNNIKFGKPDASKEEVIAAAKKARCHDFIMELKDDYDTMVEEGGASLSGGEKQRISIARAILKDAPIILLDEATASVDPDNEEQIQLAISELVRDKTLVVIAHKLSTIKNADQILVIDQ
ncbi:MAG: ABC transporter ATP-binding protein/permease, partial [Halanaerobiales bacterium]|nr:ABC transporter ATP-binding protein/permease [Halanaerobiales bacterium]